MTFCMQLLGESSKEAVRLSLSLASLSCIYDFNAALLIRFAAAGAGAERQR